LALNVDRFPNRGQKPRIAASSYLNTAPLIWSFIEGSQKEKVNLFTHQAPARCAAMLESGEVDAALVPVIQYERIDGVLVVPGVCVGSRRKVRSVVLATRCDSLREIRSVALDTSSRTSAALIQIIFREFMGFAPDFQQAEPDLNEMLDRFDAALIIGDPAMTFPRNGLNVFDMATLWRDFTGLGFVFAMWMLREGAESRFSEVNFAGARNEGLENADVITEAYERELDIARVDLKEYLLDNISFSLDEDMARGLELYFNLAHKHGLVDRLKPLRFCDAL
jgi:chorismate dehydratase